MKFQIPGPGDSILMMFRGKLLLYYLRLVLLYCLNKMHHPFPTRSRLRAKMILVENPIDFAVATRKTMIRWGDGESEMVLGNSIVYQSASNELKSELKRVLADAKQSGHYLLGLPNIKNARYKKDMRYRLRWERVFRVVNQRTDRFMSFDALVFRRKTQDHSEDGMKRLIYLTRELETIFVGSKHKLVQLASEIHDPKFIEIPETDSFGELGQIKNAIRSSVRPTGTVILVSAGPAAKILCHDLAKEGYFLVDVGNFAP